MTTPQKPWENNGATVKQGDNHSSFSMPSSGRNVLNSNAPQVSPQPVGSVRTRVLPPLPPRPPQLSVSGIRPTFGMVPNMYGGYSGYSGYGGYSSYGNYPGNMYMPGGYNNYGSYGNVGNGFENRFLQAAEEGSRNAFQSIESLVRAFTSVSMMLESTYHAMHSSFRAILGVVDNFSRLRTMFAQFLSAITILRLIKNFYRRLLNWLGILDYNPQSERVWGAVTAGDSNNQVATYSSWPLFTFIGLLFGGPYLISKLFSNGELEPKQWDPEKGKFYKSAYPHEAASEAELSFSSNEVLNVAPAEFQLQDGNGWLLARNSQGRVGYVPVTRLAHLTLPQDARIPQKNATTITTNVNTSSQTKD